MTTPKDWTLLVIAAASGNKMEPVQLQKALFLLSKELSFKDLTVKSFYSFKPYDYGPFCSDIYYDADKLEQEELITIKRPPQTRYKHFIITPSGELSSQKLRSTIKKDSLLYLDKVVNWIQNNSFNDIVKYIYNKYPDMKTNSIFKG